MEMVGGQVLQGFDRISSSRRVGPFRSAHLATDGSVPATVSNGRCLSPRAPDRGRSGADKACRL